MEKLGVKTTSELIPTHKIIDESVRLGELALYKKAHENNINDITIKIFSSNKYFTLGFKNVLPCGKIIDEEFTGHPRLQYEDKWMHTIIVLSELLPDVVYQTLLYLRSASTWVEHPILVIADKITPIISKLVSGTNIVMVTGRIDFTRLNSELFYWINRVASECHEPPVNEYKLTCSEQAALLQYMRCHNMKKVALELGISLKTAYANRISALNKLGSRNIQDFILQRECIFHDCQVNNEDFPPASGQ